MAIPFIPKGYFTATPYLYVRNAASAIEFYKKAFDAVELMRFPGPGGKIMHAEIKIGDSPIMLADEIPEMAILGPESRGGATSSTLIYVQDVDAVIKQAVAAGAKILRPVKDQFYGDRSGTVADPHGQCWNIATHKEDVSPEEMQKRFKAMLQKG